MQFSLRRSKVATGAASRLRLKVGIWQHRRRTIIAGGNWGGFSFEIERLRDDREAGARHAWQLGRLLV